MTPRARVHKHRKSIDHRLSIGSYCSIVPLRGIDRFDMGEHFSPPSHHLSKIGRRQLFRPVFRKKIRQLENFKPIDTFRRDDRTNSFIVDA